MLVNWSACVLCVNRTKASASVAAYSRGTASPTHVRAPVVCRFPQVLCMDSFSISYDSLSECSSVCYTRLRGWTGQTISHGDQETHLTDDRYATVRQADRDRQTETDRQAQADRQRQAGSEHKNRSLWQSYRQLLKGTWLLVWCGRWRGILRTVAAKNVSEAPASSHNPPCHLCIGFSACMWCLTVFLPDNLCALVCYKAVIWRGCWVVLGAGVVGEWHSISAGRCKCIWNQSVAWHPTQVCALKLTVHVWQSSTQGWLLLPKLCYLHCLNTISFMSIGFTLIIMPLSPSDWSWCPLSRFNWSSWPTTFSATDILRVQFEASDCVMQGCQGHIHSRSSKRQFTFGTQLTVCRTPLLPIATSCNLCCWSR